MAVSLFQLEQKETFKYQFAIFSGNVTKPPEKLNGWAM